MFRTIDRTVTPTGAQARWRWLAAPAVRVDVLAARERSLARLAADPTLRSRVRAVLTGQAASDAPHLPRLLWEPPPRPLRTGAFAALAAALVGLGVLAVWWPRRSMHGSRAGPSVRRRGTTVASIASCVRVCRPSSNALARLVRAGYPPAVVAAVERRVGATPDHADGHAVRRDR